MDKKDLFYIQCGATPPERINTTPFFGKKKRKLPWKVDLRNKLLPAYSQGPLGSCTANATAGLLQFHLWNILPVHRRPSRLYLWYYAKVDSDEPDPRANRGCPTDSPLKAAKKGACREEDYWPYEPENWVVKNPDTDKEEILQKVPSDEAQAHADIYIDDYAELSVRPLLDIRTALAKRQPVAAGFMVLKYFHEVRKNNSTVRMPNLPDDGEGGGHAMLIVGYDDREKLLIIRNSWSERWGDDGYCYLPYAYCKVKITHRENKKKYPGLLDAYTCAQSQVHDRAQHP